MSGAYDAYLERLLKALAGTGTLEELKDAAGKVSIAPGYYIAPERFMRDLESRVSALKSGDRQQWGLLLYSLDGDPKWYEEFKTLSPYRGGLLFFVKSNLWGLVVSGIDGFLNQLLRAAGHFGGGGELYAIHLESGMRAARITELQK